MKLDLAQDGGQSSASPPHVGLCSLAPCAIINFILVKYILSINTVEADVCVCVNKISGVTFHYVAADILLAPNLVSLLDVC